MLPRSMVEGFIAVHSNNIVPLGFSWYNSQSRFYGTPPYLLRAQWSPEGLTLNGLGR